MDSEGFPWVPSGVDSCIRGHFVKNRWRAEEAEGAGGIYARDQDQHSSGIGGGGGRIIVQSDTRTH
jgi:hypothetical protein